MTDDEFHAEVDGHLARILGMTPQEMAEQAAKNRRNRIARELDEAHLKANMQKVADYYVNRHLESTGVRLVFEFEGDGDYRA